MAADHQHHHHHHYRHPQTTITASPPAATAAARSSPTPRTQSASTTAATATTSAAAAATTSSSNSSAVTPSPHMNAVNAKGACSVPSTTVPKSLSYHHHQQSHHHHHQQQQHKQQQPVRDAVVPGYPVYCSKTARLLSLPQQQQQQQQQLFPTNNNNMHNNNAKTASTSGCTCKKSRCLKLYCQCFASSTTCGPTCKCRTCHNTTLHGEDIEKARRVILERNPAAFDTKFWPIMPTSTTTNSSNNSNNNSNSTTMTMISAQGRHPGQYNRNSSSQQQAHPGATTSMATTDTAQLYHHHHHPHQITTSTVAAASSTSTPPTIVVNKYGCKCRRTACLKKYCECFQNATYCGGNCQCINCQNTPSGGVVVHQQRQHVVVASNTAPTAASTNHHFYDSSSSLSSSSWARTVLPRAILGQNFQKTSPTTTTSIAHAATATTPSKPPPTPTDHMTMMAAVAMTELFGGGNYKDDKSIECSDKVKAKKPATTTSVATKDNNVKNKFSTPDMSLLTRAGAMTPTTMPKHHHKRKIAQEQRECAEMAITSEPDSKKAKASNSTSSTTTTSTLADEEVRAVISLESVASAESRNPSPTSSTVVQSHTLPPPMSHYSVPHGPSPLQQQQQQQRQRFLPYQSHHSGIYPRGPSSSPPSLSPYRPALTTTPHRHHHHQHPHQHHHHHHSRSSTPPTHLPYQAYTPPSMYSPQNALPPPPPPLPPPYEHFIRTSGLPKSLSFRKICSKCGKTRGEHGELGFGNKCVYQDCGKCGAGIQTHLSANQPMGILCQLTVQQGAVPGAAAAYERKIRELAVRADLQKEMQRRKRQQQQTPDRVLSMSA